MIDTTTATVIQPWRDPGLTLGERAVAWSLQELKDGVQDDAPGSHTSTRIREYLAPCIRYGRLLNLKAGNWCAASACCAMRASVLEGEAEPHEYRASGMELQQDAQYANRLRDGYWVKPGQVLDGSVVLQIGDLVVLQRGNPADRSTAWMRHVARVTVVPVAQPQDPRQNSPYKTIGGNEGGRWRLTDRTLRDHDLRGFILYPHPPRSAL